MLPGRRVLLIVSLEDTEMGTVFPIIEAVFPEKTKSIALLPDSKTVGTTVLSVEADTVAVFPQRETVFPERTKTTVALLGLEIDEIYFLNDHMKRFELQNLRS